MNLNLLAQRIKNLTEEEINRVKELLEKEQS